jgi:hypothetical protein
MTAAAQSTGAANDGAKTTFNPALTTNTAWTSNGPQVPGTHFIISITDSASAAQYGLQTAELSRAGDDAAPGSRVFVAPNADGLLAGEQSFVSSPVPGVMVPNPSTTAAGAYPLAMLTYAATRPETLTAAQRQQYATFLTYAIGDGQTSGVEIGQLPAGYVPLPGALRLQALTAINSILHPPPVPTTPTSPTVSTTTPSSFGSTDTGSSGSGDDTSTGSSAASTPFTAPSASAVANPAVLHAVHTSWFSAGAIRWTLLLLLIVGLAAALGALLLGRVGRRPLTVADVEGPRGPTEEP